MMLKRYTLIVLGSVFLALGAIGVFLPLLPTTPFLLLAAACYLRSSPELYQRLLASRVLGSYLRAYHSGTGVPRRAKILTIALLWLTIGYSIIFVVDSLAVRVVLALIAIGVTAHVLSLRSTGYPRQ